jgi:ABC-type sugar transport system ATPase subunit
MSDSILSMSHITKTFPGVKALSDVSVTLRRNEVLALVGENGAGKSTLMKILGGVYQAEEGTIQIEGTDIKSPTLSPHSEWVSASFIRK